MMIISGKIDVTKIDKSKLYKGIKGTYLDVVIRLNDENDQYGNRGMITQGVTQEERQNGIRGAILGNIKVIFDNSIQGNTVQSPKVDMDDDLPF